MNIFYVYEHWRPDRDECFYVGKGTGRRANVLYGRNGHHTAIQKKLERLGLCVEVKLVRTDLTEDEAHAFEVERIAFWRADGADLANLTDGGEGGANPAESTRALMRKAKLGRKLSDEHKAKVGAASKRAAQNPEYLKKLSDGIRAAKSTPECKAKMSASQKARIRTKEHYEKVAAALRGKRHTAETRALLSAQRKGKPRDPVASAKAADSNRGRKRSPEFCQRMKDAWTPERRARHAENMANAIRGERGRIVKIASAE